MPDVFALAARFTPAGTAGTPAVLAEALDRWIRRGGRERELPALDPAEGWARSTEDGGIVRWEVFDGKAGGSRTHASLYELTWRHPHRFQTSPYLPTSEAPEITWSTRVSCVVEPDGNALLGVRVANTGPGLSSPDVLRTTRPRFLPELARVGTLFSDDAQLSITARLVRGADVGDVVRFELFDPARRMPVVLLTPGADGKFTVQPSAIAEELFSVARVYAIATPEDTFALTDALGRRDLSVFHGGMRVYLPGLTRDSSALSHPLLTTRRLQDRAARNRIAAYLALRSPERYVDDPRFSALRDERAAYEDAQRRNVIAALHESTRQARAAGDDRALAELYAKDNDRLSGEVQRLEEYVGELESQLKQADDEIRQLKYRLARRAPDDVGCDESADASPAPVPESVLDVIELAADSYSEHLLFLPSAYSTAEDSNYGRPQEVLDGLGILAQIAARRASPQGLGKRLDAACKETGLDYRQGISESTPKKMRKQYLFKAEDGTVHECCEHLVFGKGTYDPEHVLRVYFTYKSKGESRFVIGHVGRHLDVQTTT